MHYATKVIEDIEKIRKMNYAQVKYTYRDFSIPIEPSVVEDGMSVWVQIKPSPLGLRFPSKVSIKYHEIDHARFLALKMMVKRQCFHYIQTRLWN